MYNRYAKLLLIIFLLWLTACEADTVPPTPSATPLPSPTLTSTPTPSPTPTATPRPPLAVTVRGLDAVSAVAPKPVVVEMVPPPEGTSPPAVTALVLDPGGATYARFTLEYEGSGRYVATEPLYLPLQPSPGRWRVAVGVKTRRSLIGDQAMDFEPAPITYHPLTDTLPVDVSLQVPEVFEEIGAQGNPRAGSRTWRYRETHLELWWAPGPSEPLQRDVALTMLEATRDARAPEITAFEATVWEERDAFAFEEASSSEGWVLQDDNHTLYVLRIEITENEHVRSLLQEVIQTFRLVSE